MISDTHSSQLALHTTDLEDPSMDASHQDPKDQGSPGCEANIDSSSTDPDISLHTISLPSMMPSLPMTPSLPTNTLSPTSPSLPPTQTSQLRTPHTPTP